MYEKLGTCEGVNWEGKVCCGCDRVGSISGSVCVACFMLYCGVCVEMGTIYLPVRFV